tara:strand:- start:49 stop:225 length:177 start_codon:yes stop_codon:yes gene_type:complete
METITIPKEKYEEMLKKIQKLEELEKSKQDSDEVDWNLVNQFKEGLEDVKEGRIERVA